jgi:crotonobetaine/carnitine-CoA ligase
VSCSGIPADQHQAIEDRWGVPWREAYGTTEIGFAIAMTEADHGKTGSGSIGRLLPGYEGRLIDAEGREVPRGEVGQFICRAPLMSRGYWNKPEATAAWLRDGWAHTGDLMRQDSEGYYYLVGRTKDMIRRGGENIAAAEVEAILCEHPQVRNAACLAVSDEIRGEEVKAVIQPVDSLPDPESVLEHCRRRLAAFKVPRYVAFVTEFPLTPSQRVEKHKLSRETAGSYDATTRRWR